MKWNSIWFKSKITSLFRESYGNMLLWSKLLRERPIRRVWRSKDSEIHSCSGCVLCEFLYIFIWVSGKHTHSLRECIRDITGFFYRISITDSVWSTSKWKNSIEFKDRCYIKIWPTLYKNFEYFHMRASLYCIEYFGIWIERVKFCIILFHPLSKKIESWGGIMFLSFFQFFYFLEREKVLERDTSPFRLRRSHGYENLRK